MSEVAFFGYTLPDNAIRIRQLMVHRIETEEGEGRVAQALHKGYSQLFAVTQVGVVVDVPQTNGLWVSTFNMPVFRDGWHQTIRVPVIMPMGIVVLGTPDTNLRMAGKRLCPRTVIWGDTKQMQVIIIGRESLSETDYVFVGSDSFERVSHGCELVRYPAVPKEQYTDDADHGNKQGNL